MKKNTIKAFTLVEMLIVIVIIGILIAALMPRMQAAQWRARDVSRKTALSQIQTAIVTYQWDKWEWPGMSWGNATWWMAVSGISEEIRTAWMNSVPSDPISSNTVEIWSGTSIEAWQYGYLVMKRNWTKDGWFALIAHTEVEWWSNRVVCSWATSASSINSWWLKNSNDVSEVQLCSSFKYNKNGTDCSVTWWVCTYNYESELRYLTVY